MLAGRLAAVVQAFRATGTTAPDRALPPHEVLTGHGNEIILLVLTFAVAVEVQRAGQTRFFGASCWHDAGIVVRGPAAALAEAKVYLDAPGTILVRVFDGRGAVLVKNAQIDKESLGDRVSWMLPPPEPHRVPTPRANQSTARDGLEFRVR